MNLSYVDDAGENCILFSFWNVQTVCIYPVLRLKFLSFKVVQRFWGMDEAWNESPFNLKLCKTEMKNWKLRQTMFKDNKIRKFHLGKVLLDNSAVCSEMKETRGVKNTPITAILLIKDSSLEWTPVQDHGIFTETIWVFKGIQRHYEYHWTSNGTLPSCNLLRDQPKAFFLCEEFSFKSTTGVPLNFKQIRVSS